MPSPSKKEGSPIVWQLGMSLILALTSCSAALNSVAFTNILLVFGLVMVWQYRNQSSTIRSCRARHRPSARVGQRRRMERTARIVRRVQKAVEVTGPILIPLLRLKGKKGNEGRTGDDLYARLIELISKMVTRD